MSTVRLMNRTSQKIEYTTGWFAIRGTTTDGNEIYGWIYGNYVYSIYEADDHSLSDSEIQAIVNRLENTSSIVASKRNTAARIAQTLLENGYAPSFAAGMIANSIDEGTIGRFETCDNPPQDYLQYIETEYNYSANYNYKTIMDVNVNVEDEGEDKVTYFIGENVVSKTEYDAFYSALSQEKVTWTSIDRYPVEQKQPPM